MPCKTAIIYYENDKKIFSFFSTSSFTTYDSPEVTKFSLSEDGKSHDPDEKLLPDQILLTGPGPGLGHGGLHHDTSNKCQPNKTFIWCLPVDYNQEKHPFTCKKEHRLIY